MTTEIGALIESARVAAGLSQRALTDATNISHPTLSRILSGERPAKMPEIMAIAGATGHTVAQLTKTETVADRVQWSVGVTSDPNLESMREQLLHFAELNDYLNDQGIPAADL